MSFESGHVLGSRYRLEERIAMGGMGEVWRARDETLARDVAVKVMRPDTAADAGFAERFRAEARHMGVLRHPNIGTVHDFGDDDNTAYLVMELLEGEPLSAIIAASAPMDPERITDILYQTASALQAAHDAEVVHRDIKPANIVVNADGYAKLTDFGISRALSEAPLTQTGEVLGTPHYLSPEQAQGQPAGPLSDVYALAVVGYEMITGERPFAGESMVTTALAHVSQAAPPLPDTVPDPLRTTVMAALAKDPAQRPQSAAEFAAALRTPAEELPDSLRQAAASAVAPVIVGVPVTLPPDVMLPTSVIATGEVTVLTPTGLARIVPLAPATPLPATPARDAAPPRWRLLVLAAVAVIAVVVIAVAVAARSGSASGGGGPTGPVPAATAAATAGSQPSQASTTTTTTHASTAPASSTAAQPASHAGKGKGKGGKHQ